MRAMLAFGVAPGLPENGTLAGKPGARWYLLGGRPLFIGQTLSMSVERFYSDGLRCSQLGRSPDAQLFVAVVRSVQGAGELHLSCTADEWHWVFRLTRNVCWCVCW